MDISSRDDLPRVPESEANEDLNAPALSVLNGISDISPASARSILRGVGYIIKRYLFY
jgi:hypothetical protein